MRTKHTTESILEILRLFYFSEITVDCSRFTWNNQKVLKLLDSISKDYPIGSIVLDRAANNSVIVGENRLIALLRCFVSPTQGLNVANLNMHYDLIEKVFLFTDNTSDTQIALYNLINSKAFFAWQKLFKDKDNIEMLIDKYDRMGNILSKYEVPLAKLFDASIEDVNTIIQRLG